MVAVTPTLLNVLLWKILSAWWPNGQSLQRRLKPGVRAEWSPLNELKITSMASHQVPVTDGPELLTPHDHVSKRRLRIDDLPCSIMWWHMQLARALTVKCVLVPAKCRSSSCFEGPSPTKQSRVSDGSCRRRSFRMKRFFSAGRVSDLSCLMCRKTLHTTSNKCVPCS